MSKRKLAKIVMISGVSLVIGIPVIAFSVSIGLKGALLFIGLLVIMFIWALAMAWASTVLQDE